MINTEILLSPIDIRSSLLSWTVQNPELVSWVFINGQCVYGPIKTEEAFRTAIVQLGSGDIKALEIHDVPEDVNPDPIGVVPNTAPKLVFNSVTGSVKYKIYYKSSLDNNQTLIYERFAAGDIQKYVINCPVKLDGKGGQWHFFRVESVDIYGNQSLRQLWCYYAMEPPEAVNNLAITEGSAAGTFNFALE